MIYYAECNKNGDEMYKKNKKGYTLTELLISLGIIATIIILTFYFYPKIKNSNTINNEVININSIISGINVLYNNQNSVNILNNELLIQAKIIPNGMLSNEKNRIINAWGGDVLFSIYNIKTHLSLISIKYKAIPQSQCASFISLVQKNFTAITIGTPYFNSDNQQTIYIKNKYKNIYFSINNVSKACSNNTNEITFYLE